MKATCLFHSRSWHCSPPSPFETEQEPVGLQPTKAFLCPWIFSVGNRLHSASGVFPVPKGRIKQLLIREQRGCGDKGKQSRNNSAAFLQGPDDPSRDMHNNIFEVFGRYWNPHQVKEVICCPQLCRSQATWKKLDKVDSKLPQFSSVTQLCPTICNLMDCSTPGFHVYQQLPELAQTPVCRVSDAIQPSHPLSSPSPAFILPSIRIFSSESVLCIRWPKYWSFSFSICPSNEYSGLISYRID